MTRSFFKFWKDESGATAIEYGLIAAGIAARDHCRGQRTRQQSEHNVQLDQQLVEVTICLLLLGMASCRPTSEMVQSRHLDSGPATSGLPQ